MANLLSGPAEKYQTSLTHKITVRGNVVVGERERGGEGGREGGRREGGRGPREREKEGGRGEGEGGRERGRERGRLREGEGDRERSVLAFSRVFPLCQLHCR